MGRVLESAEKSFNPLRHLLAGFGMVLILSGVCLLLFFGHMTYQVFTAPQDIQLIQFVIDLLNVKEPVLKGKFTFATPSGPQAANFEMELAPEIKSVIFIFLGGFIFAIFVSIAKSLIEGGVHVIKGALYEGDIVKKA